MVFTDFRVTCNKKTIDKALCRSTASYLKMVNGKYIDKEPNTLVASFREMLSTMSETAVADENMICLSLCTRNKDCMS